MAALLDMHCWYDPRRGDQAWVGNNSGLLGMYSRHAGLREGTRLQEGDREKADEQERVHLDVNLPPHVPPL